MNDHATRGANAAGNPDGSAGRLSRLPRDHRRRDSSDANDGGSPLAVAVTRSSQPWRPRLEKYTSPGWTFAMTRPSVSKTVLDEANSLLNQNPRCLTRSATPRTCMRGKADYLRPLGANPAFGRHRHHSRSPDTRSEYPAGAGEPRQQLQWNVVFARNFWPDDGAVSTAT